MSQLVLLAGESLTAAEQRLLKFAEWMGISTKAVFIEHAPHPTAQSLPGVDSRRANLAMSAAMLARAHAESPQYLKRALHERCRSLLVFGCDDPDRHSGPLSSLTGGRVRGVLSPAHGQNVFDLPDRGREFSRQLAGLSFSTERTHPVAAFDWTADGAEGQAIMLANRQPVFIRLAATSCEIFLVAGAEVPDIDEPLSPKKGIEAYYDQLIPFLVFLGRSFAKGCWHGPRSTARFIIDDPLLTERYGFLDYHTLLSSMRRERYGTSLAFVPWNYRRTSGRTASNLFKGRPDFSICVHGCDHTSTEFEASDEGLLEWKAGLALERMERHQARTGLPFERVMVFPQGRFSINALRALRRAEYLAAVNSTCFPTDEGSARLTIADFLRPAITRFHGFPIFQRRYPRRLIDSAFDLFLGKPALLVEHHHYFCDGGKHLEEFVTALRNLEPTLTWPTLSSQLMRTCIMRFLSPDSVGVQFFTRRFRLENTDENRRHFRLAKYEPDASAIRGVLADGISVPFVCHDNQVELELEVNPGQTRDIEVVDYPPPPRCVPRMGLLYNTGVFIRRALSEFRDNTLSRHPSLLRVATGLTDRLRVTGDRRGGP